MFTEQELEESQRLCEIAFPSGAGQKKRGNKPSRARKSIAQPSKVA